MSYETLMLRQLCINNDINFIIHNDNKKIEANKYIPVGGVKFCLKILNKNIQPNYYPEWLESYFHRKIFTEDKWIIGEKLFVKPNDVYKRFNGFITYGTYKKKKEEN